MTFSGHEEAGHPTNIAQAEMLAERYADADIKAGMPKPTFWERSLEWEREHAGERSYPYVTGQDVWWIGFDCAHLGDLSPKYEKLTAFSYGGTYRNRDYVFHEIEGLVQQALAVLREDGKDATPAT